MRVSATIPAGEIEVEVSGNFSAGRTAASFASGGFPPETDMMEDVEVTALYMVRMMPRQIGEKAKWVNVDILRGLDEADKAIVLSNVQECMDADDMDEALFGEAAE
jgi:hypothetical protein